MFDDQEEWAIDLCAHHLGEVKDKLEDMGRRNAPRPRRRGPEHIRERMAEKRRQQGQ
jgi:hypothetical protein